MRRLRHKKIFFNMNNNANCAKSHDIIADQVRGETNSEYPCDWVLKGLSEVYNNRIGIYRVVPVCWGGVPALFTNNGN